MTEVLLAKYQRALDISEQELDHARSEVRDLGAQLVKCQAVIQSMTAAMEEIGDIVRRQAE